MKAVPETGRRRAVAALGASLCAPLLGLIDGPRAWARGAGAPSGAAPGASSATSSVRPGVSAASAPELETVVTLRADFPLSSFGVSSTGRVFATAPSSSGRGRYSVVEVDTTSGALHPFPDGDWNRYDPKSAGDRKWISARAVWFDERDHLWLLDSSLPSADPRTQPPKLVEFDIQSAQMLRTYTYRNLLMPEDLLDDVRIDLKHGYAYVGNAGKCGGIVVTRLSDGKSRLLLAGDRSSVPDLRPHPAVKVGDRIVAKPDSGIGIGSGTGSGTGSGSGSGIGIGIVAAPPGGIAISPQRDWLYHRPTPGHHYWRIPTEALIDEALAPNALALRVESVGDYALTGGLLTTPDGILYGGDPTDRTIVALTPTVLGGRPAFEQRVFLDEPQPGASADRFAYQKDYLYVAGLHAHAAKVSTGRSRDSGFTIFRARLPKQPAGLYAG